MPYDDWSPESFLDNALPLLEKLGNTDRQGDHLSSPKTRGRPSAGEVGAGEAAGRPGADDRNSTSETSSAGEARAIEATGSSANASSAQLSQSRGNGALGGLAGVESRASGSGGEVRGSGGGKEGVENGAFGVRSAGLDGEGGRVQWERGSGSVPVIVVCRRGNDSQRAVDILRKRGFGGAVDVVGGLQAWAHEIEPSFPLY